MAAPLIAMPWKLAGTGGMAFMLSALNTSCLALTLSEGLSSNTKVFLQGSFTVYCNNHSTYIYIYVCVCYIIKDNHCMYMF